MNKKIILIIGLLLITPTVLANPNIDWLTPNQQGEVIDTYPQIIRFVTRDTTTINNCSVNIGNYHYEINISNNKTEVQITTRLTENTYNITINCTNGINSTIDSKNITINDLINIQKQGQDDKRITLYIIIMIIGIIIYLTSRTPIYQLLSATTMMIASIIIYTQIKETLLVIPIIATITITLYATITTIFK